MTKETNLKSRPKCYTLLWIEALTGARKALMKTACLLENAIPEKSSIAEALALNEMFASGIGVTGKKGKFNRGGRVYTIWKNPKNGKTGVEFEIFVQRSIFGGMKKRRSILFPIDGREVWKYSGNILIREPGGKKHILLFPSAGRIVKHLEETLREQSHSDGIATGEAALANSASFVSGLGVVIISGVSNCGGVVRSVVGCPSTVLTFDVFIQEQAGGKMQCFRPYSMTLEDSEIFLSQGNLVIRERKTETDVVLFPNAEVFVRRFEQNLKPVS